MSGNFSFVKDEGDRGYLEDAYRAMESTRGSWKIMKKSNDSLIKRFLF